MNRKKWYLTKKYIALKDTINEFSRKIKETYGNALKF